MRSFVEAEVNAPVQDLGIPGDPKDPPVEQFVSGFVDPHNVAQRPDGRLWIVEDNSPSDIWVADKDRGRTCAITHRKVKRYV